MLVEATSELNSCKRGRHRHYAQSMLLRSMGLCTATTDVLRHAMLGNTCCGGRSNSRCTLGDQTESLRQSSVGSVERLSVSDITTLVRLILESRKVGSSSTNPIDGYASQKPPFLIEIDLGWEYEIPFPMEIDGLPKSHVLPNRDGYLRDMGKFLSESDRYNTGHQISLPD